ncbi:MAG: hypothetical protein ACO3X1_15945, partial [Burkholderiaceae bacterium]
MQPIAGEEGLSRFLSRAEVAVIVAIVCPWAYLPQSLSAVLMPASPLSSRQLPWLDGQARC